MPSPSPRNPTYFISWIDRGDSIIDEVRLPCTFPSFVQETFIGDFVVSFHVLEPPNLASVGGEVALPAHEFPCH